MYYTEQQIRSKKRKNMAGIIVLCLLIAMGIGFLAGAAAELLGVQITNIEDISVDELQEQNIYYFEELTLEGIYGYVESSTGAINSRDFLVSFEDGNGDRYCTSIRLEYNDDPYFDWVEYVEEGTGTSTVSGCFHYYDDMGSYVEEAFLEACEKSGLGEPLALSFFFDADDPDAYRADKLSGTIILIVMGLIFAVPSLIGVIVLFKKRKKIGVVQTQPEAQSTQVVEKFLRTYRAVKLWRYILWGYFLLSIVGIILTANEVFPFGFFVLFAPSWLVLLIYCCATASVIQSKKLLDANGITEEQITTDLFYADFVAEQFRCGNRLFLVKGKILPIRSIAWIYLHQQLYMGVVTTARNIFLYTDTGKKISIAVSKEEVELFNALLNRNRMKFRPDLCIGYTEEARARYKQIKNATKARG